MSGPDIELQRQQSASHRFDDNFDGLIVNPLRHLNDDQLRDDVERFAEREILAADPTLDRAAVLRLFRKGAEIARFPLRWDTVEGLRDEERSALTDERAHVFRQPWKLYLTFITCSVGACVQGWDQTGLIAANLIWPVELGLPACQENAPRYYWLFGLVNASPFFAAALIGTVLADPLSNGLMFGRRGVIAFAAVFCLLSVIGSAVSQTWYQLLVTRLLLGIGIGSKASTVPVFAAENSPTSIRGSVVMGWQLFDAFGIFLGYSANLILYNVYPSLAWRLQAGSAIVPTIPLLALIYFCPESPRWYIKHQRFADAYKSARKLRNSDLQAARDIYFMYKQIEVEKLYLEQKYRQWTGQNVERKESFLLRVRELITIGRIRRATVASFVVMLAQQLCGINIFSFYSATVFASTSVPNTNQCPNGAVAFSDVRNLWYGWGTGLCNFLFTLPVIKTIDVWGRRNLLLLTFPIMALMMLATGLSTLAKDDSTNKGLFIFFSMVFIAFYSLGEGPVAFTYSAESFPLSHREAGMGFAVTTNLFFAGILTLVFPSMIQGMTFAGALGLFAFFNVVALLLIFFLVPETAARSLEDLDYIFGVPTKTHAKHQGKVAEFYLHAPGRRGERPNIYKTSDDVASWEAAAAAGQPDVSQPASRASVEQPPRRPMAEAQKTHAGAEARGLPGRGSVGTEERGLTGRDRRRGSVPSDVSVSSEEGDPRAPRRRGRPAGGI